VNLRTGIHFRSIPGAVPFPWAEAQQRPSGKAQCPMTFEDTMTDGRQPRLAMVLRLVLEHLDSGGVVALTPAEMRLAHRLAGALAAFDVSARVWSEPLAAGEAG
jgi:hypothetical protein